MHAASAKLWVDKESSQLRSGGLLMLLGFIINKRRMQNVNTGSKSGRQAPQDRTTRDRNRAVRATSSRCIGVQWADTDSGHSDHGLRCAIRADSDSDHSDHG